MIEQALHQGERMMDGMEIAHWLNSGIVFLDKDLQLTVYNTLAARLLDVAASVDRPVPLRQCLQENREEYHWLADMVVHCREYRNAMVTWTMGRGIRHVLIDSYRRDGVQGFTGMFILMKDLGDFSVLEQHMQRTEKLATIGKIAAGIAHEIRNPLTTVRGFLQMLNQRYERQNDAEQQAYVQVMLQEIDRVNTLVSELLLLAKPHKTEKIPSDVKRLVEDLMPLVASEALLRGIEVCWQLRDTPLVWADSAMMKQVVLNLVKNALEAMDDEGTLSVSLDVHGGMVQLDVADTGPGIPYYQMDKVFDAFFTTKEKGTGLGLPICQRIVADHRGEIRVSSKGFGATFSILLPVWEQGVDMSQI